jgi:hypothetical protein
METIKTITLVMVLVFLFGCACPDLKTPGEYPTQEIKDETKSYTIYKHNSIIPEYEVRDVRYTSQVDLCHCMKFETTRCTSPEGLSPCMN